VWLEGAKTNFGMVKPRPELKEGEHDLHVKAPTAIVVKAMPWDYIGFGVVVKDEPSSDSAKK